MQRHGRREKTRSKNCASQSGCTSLHALCYSAFVSFSIIEATCVSFGSISHGRRTNRSKGVWQCVQG